MKKSLIITLIILVIGTLSLTGYLLFKNSSNETNIKEVFNNIIKKEETTSDTSSDSDTDAEYNATIGDTTVNLNTENKEWPTEIPSDIPEFKYGDIETVSKVTNDYVNSWTIIYQNVSENDFGKYKKDLDENDFKTVTSLDTPQGIVITLNKETFTLVVTYINEEETLSIGVSESLE